MMTAQNLETQYGIPLAPKDDKLRLSIYLKFSGTSSEEIRSNIERDIKHQTRELHRFHPAASDLKLIRTAYEQISLRLQGFNLSRDSEGVVAFAEEGCLKLHFMPKLEESFVAASSTYHIRPLLRLAGYFSHYMIVTLHANHTAGYLRHRGIVKKVFSHSPESRVPIGFLSSRQKKKNTEQMLEYALDQIKNNEDMPVCVFGSRYLRSRFKRLLEAHQLRSPAMESGAKIGLSDLVRQCDERMGVDPDASVLTLREKMDAANRSGLLVTNIQEIMQAAYHNAIDSLVVTSPQMFWSESTLPLSARSITKTQSGLSDDCLLDDLAEGVLKSGGKVAEYQFLHSVGAPAFAILRWKSRPEVEIRPSLKAEVLHRLPRGGWHDPRREAANR